ncbi:MAG: hypoxanthine phosphoribosyltransferase [Planctomycetota bacterium]
MHPHIERVLCTESEIQARIADLAVEISGRLGDEPLTVVGVLNGAVVFVSDLIRHLRAPLELAFVSASSYRGGTTSGALELDFLPKRSSIEGRRVLLVDDILDTGKTMRALMDEFRGNGAAEVFGCVLLDKPSRRVVDCGAEFVGFSIEDAFVVGYGLDYRGLYRNLPYIGVLKPEHAAAAASN